MRSADGELGFEPADERRRKAPLTPEAPSFSRGADHYNAK